MLAKLCLVAEMPVPLSAWVSVTVWVRGFPREGCAFGLSMKTVSVTEAIQA